MKIILTILCLFALPGVLSAFWASAISLFISQSFLIAFAIGGIAGLLLRFILKLIFTHRGVQTINIFEHELTHALVALVFLRSISQFRVWHSGGNVEYTSGFGGRLGDIFIILAPYFLPTLTLVAALLKPLLPSSWYFGVDVGIGMTLVYHTFSTFQEFSLDQPDIMKIGLFFSLIFVFTFFFAIHGLLFFLITEGYSGIGHWARGVFEVSWGVYHNLYVLLEPYIR